jgi:hypothetical protein
MTTRAPSTSTSPARARSCRNIRIVLFGTNGVTNAQDVDIFSEAGCEASGNALVA